MGIDFSVGMMYNSNRKGDDAVWISKIIRNT